MKQCRLERKKIINQELDQSAKMMESTGATGAAAAALTPEMILQQEAEKGAAMIEMEKARIKKMQARQQRELEQMIDVSISRKNSPSNSYNNITQYYELCSLRSSEQRFKRT
jgi:hypothetical protein